MTERGMGVTVIPAEEEQSLSYLSLSLNEVRHGSPEEDIVKAVVKVAWQASLAAQEQPTKQKRLEGEFQVGVQNILDLAVRSYLVKLQQIAKEEIKRGRRPINAITLSRIFQGVW